MLAEREQEYGEHRRYKESFDEVTSWLGRARERLPWLKHQSLSDKLALESSLAPLQALLNKRPQGELLLEQVITSSIKMLSIECEKQFFWQM